MPSRLSAEPVFERGDLLFGQELEEGRGHAAVRLEHRIGKPLCAAALGKVYTRVDVLARHRGAQPLGVDRPHAAARVNRALEHRKVGAGGDVGDVDKLEPVTGVRLIAAPSVHRLGVRNAAELVLELYPEAVLPQLFDKPFGNRHHVLGILDIGHLHVDLRKLGLTVGAQILVAEAARNLIVPVHAGNHQQLLVQLRRLRQCVKFAVVDAAGHEIVARALGRRLAQKRRLYLEEAVVAHVVAHGARNFVAHHEDVLKRLAAKVEIAVFEPQSLARLDVVRNHERRGLRLGQYLDVVGENLDLTGRDALVDVRASAAHDARTADDILASDRSRLVEHAAVAAVVESDLDDARPVAHVDEQQVAQIAVLGDKAHHSRAAAYVGRAQLSAHVRPLCSVEKICHITSPYLPRRTPQGPPSRPPSRRRCPYFLS